MFLRYTPAIREDLGFTVQRATFEFDLLQLPEFAYEQRDFCEHLKDVPGQDPSAECGAEPLEDVVVRFIGFVVQTEFQWRAR